MQYFPIFIIYLYIISNPKKKNIRNIHLSPANEKIYSILSSISPIPSLERRFNPGGKSQWIAWRKMAEAACASGGPRDRGWKLRGAFSGAVSIELAYRYQPPDNSRSRVGSGIDTASIAISTRKPHGRMVVGGGGLRNPRPSFKPLLLARCANSIEITRRLTTV